MGFSICWIGVKGQDKIGALKLFEMRDTGVEDETNDAPYSAANTESNWAIIWSNDLTFAGDEPRLGRISKMSPLLACFVEEHTMFSLAILYEGGEAIWSIMHQGDGEDVFHLEKAGAIPSFLVEIEDHLMAKQRAEGGRAADVDYVFEIPLLAAKQLTGFKHDEVGPVFTVAEPI